MTLRCLPGLVFGWLLVVVGVIVTPLPIPIGLLLLGVGVSLLLPCSGFMRRLVVRVRRRYPGIFSRP